MKKETDRLLKASLHLIGKVNIIHNSEKYKRIWFTAQSHLGEYDGLDYIDELRELTDATIALTLKGDDV